MLNRIVLLAIVVFVVAPVIVYLACMWLAYGINTQLLPLLNGGEITADSLFWNCIHVLFPASIILSVFLHTGTQTKVKS